MKFLCPNCKAKYQISDEKIAGRTLKMDCRRCNHPIVIRGDKAAHRSRSSSAALSPTASRHRGSYSGPAPGVRSSGRGSLGADFRKNASSPPAPQKPTALDQWHIAINDVPVGPMKRAEVANKIASGAVTKASLCWREGYDDWRELRNVPELNALLRRAAAPPAPKKPAFPPPPGRALGSRGPARAGRPPAGRQPAQQRPQPQRPAASRPAARGNVVPIGGRLGGGAAPALEEYSDDFLEDEPTRVGTEYDFKKMEAEQRLLEEKERLAADEAQRAEDAARHAEEQRAEEARLAEEEQQKKAIGLAPTAEIAHSDAFDPFASQAGPAPVASQPAFAAPTAEAVPVPMEAIPERRRRAIPIGAWIAIAGAMSFGMVLAIMVGTHYLTQEQVAAAVPTPAPAPTPVEPELETDVPEEPVAVPEEEPPETDEGEPTEQPAQGTGQTQQPAAVGGTGRRGGTTNNASTGGGGRRTNPNLSAEEQARLARFAGDSTSTAPVNVRQTPLERDTQRQGTQLTADQIRAVVTRQRMGVTRCYETAARGSGTAPRLRIDVDVTVAGSGIVTRANARGESFGNITDCIERTVRRWHFPRTGAESRVSIPFVFQGRDG